MKTIKTSIETELICSDDGKNTYCITKRLNGVEGETGIVIMLFPTRNEKNLNADDSTINHIVAHMGDFGLLFNAIALLLPAFTRRKAVFKLIHRFAGENTDKHA